MKKLFLFAFILGATTLTSCKEEGCTDPDATNYNSDADKNDGSCIYPPEDEEEALSVTSIMYYDVNIDGVNEREEVSAFGTFVASVGGSSGSDNQYGYHCTYEDFFTDRLGMRIGYNFFHEHLSGDTVPYPSPVILSVGQKQFGTFTDYQNKFYIEIEGDNGQTYSSKEVTQTGSVIEVTRFFEFTHMGEYGIKVEINFNNVRVASYDNPGDVKVLTDGKFIGVYQPIF